MGKPPDPTVKTKYYPDPADNSPMIRGRMSLGQFMDPAKKHTEYTAINGHERYVPYGEFTNIPADTRQLLRNACISYVKSSPMDRFQHGLGGQGRPQSQVMNSEAEIVTIPMYDWVDVPSDDKKGA